MTPVLRLVGWLTAAVLLQGVASAAPTSGAAPTPKKAPSGVSQPFAVIDAPGGTIKAPLFSPEHEGLAVAEIDGEKVSLGELADVLASMHMGRGNAKTPGAKKEFKPVLDRLIGTRLIILEAKEMGLHELPEIHGAISNQAEIALRETVKERATAHVRADALEVDRLYRHNVAEYKLRSVLFKNVLDANAFVGALKSGTDFAALAKEAVTAGKAAGGADAEFFPRDKVLPQVLEVAAQIPKGAYSGAIQVDDGFVVMKVEDVRWPKNDEILAAAQEQVLSAARVNETFRFAASLEKKYARIDEKLLASLDFEAEKPGMESLRKDKRVVATIQGAAPILVSDVAHELDMAFFHGVESAIREKKLNAKKESVFKQRLHKTLLDVEARAQKISELPEYKAKVSAYENSVLFGTFVQRAITPSIEVMESEGLAYYEKNKKKEFTFPAFYRLSSLAFTSQRAAQSAFDQLKKGTDFKWLRTNAKDQLAEDRREFDLDSKLLTQAGLPPPLAKTLAGTKPDDVRLYESKGAVYLIQVREVTPPTAQPYPEVREQILKKLYGEKLNAAVDEWIAKLRKARDVKVFVRQIGT